MEKIKCSVPILTLNCKDALKKCLESIKNFSDIVVLDGNSTDGTQEIARQYGARVFRQYETDEPNQRIKNFSQIRIKSLEKTNEDWILCLDSDEYISKELLEEIRIIVNKNEKNIAYKIPVLAIVKGKIIKHAFHYPNALVRLYNKESGIRPKETKIVHETDYIPENIIQKMTEGVIYTKWPDIKTLLKKDDYYLSLMRKKTAEGIKARPFSKVFKKVFINILKAGSIGFKCLLVYAKYGFEATLPIKYNWRYIRYHLLLAKDTLILKIWESLKIKSKA